MFAFLFVVILGLCYFSQDSSQLFLDHPRLSGPSEALVQDVVEFNCELESYPQNESILLQLFKEGKRDKLLGEYTSLNQEVASFPIIIKPNHEGNLECQAKVQNNSNIEPTVSNIHYLRVVEPVQGARIVVRSTEVEFFEGEMLELQCTLAAGNHVSYMWLLNGQLVSQSSSHNDQLLINRTTSKDSGSYMCVATNNFNQTEFFTASSTEVVITVKERVSNADISFTVLKKDEQNYFAMVTCQSTKGTPPITFSLYNRTELVASMTSEKRDTIFEVPLLLGQHLGWLQCQARNTDQIKNSQWILVEVEPVQGARIVVRSEEVEFFEGEMLELQCTLAAGNHVSYKWLLNGQLVYQSSSHNDQLLINRTTSKDSGSYMCVATNNFNQTEFFTANSTEVVITVKERVSNADISFTVLKKDEQNYFAMVTCQSTKGTPPITFSLYNGTELVANMTSEKRDTIFEVPLLLGQHLGWLQCQASNTDQIEYSQCIPLEVVPVGGPVMMNYDYDVGQNYAVIDPRFYCKAAKGSLPVYQWFLNKTLLDDQGSFYRVDNQPPEQSILRLSVGRSSAGTYHCEVSDSFDSTNTISSKRRYLDKEVLNRLPVWVVAVVFGCFTVLVLLVSVCCWIGVAFRRRQFGEKSLLGFEMDRIVAANEVELDLSDYTEDADVGQTVTDGDFDQVSQSSVDEWPQIEEEKKTLEDEAVEEA